MALSRDLGGPNVLQNAADLRERATGEASRFSPAVSDLALRVPASQGLSAARNQIPHPLLALPRKLRQQTRSGWL